jgi:FMN phosphatase YigB (HAD superfamily)
MAFKSLVLDIDGVLIRDKLLLNHVQDNCVKYVASKLPDAKNPREVNRILYLTHGHTAVGLETAFKIDASDFNEKVYDKSVMEHLADVIYGSEFQEEAVQIHDLGASGWNLTLFTNAPEIWAKPVALAIGDVVNIKCPRALKPSAEAFEDFAGHHTHLYVDDSLKNLGTARWLPNWHPVHYFDGPLGAKPWCPTVNSIWELCLYVNSVDQWISDNHNLKLSPFV